MPQRAKKIRTKMTVIKENEWNGILIWIDRCPIQHCINVSQKLGRKRTKSSMKDYLSWVWLNIVQWNAKSDKRAIIYVQEKIIHKFGCAFSVLNILNSEERGRMLISFMFSKEATAHVQSTKKKMKQEPLREAIRS